MDIYQQNVPEIQSVSIAPNKANAKTSIKISVQVIDREITFNKVIEFSTEIYAGQRIGVL